MVKIVHFFSWTALVDSFWPAHHRLGILVGRVNQRLQTQIQQTVKLQKQKEETGWLLLHTPRWSVAVNAESLLLLALLPAYVKGRTQGWMPVGGRKRGGLYWSAASPAPLFSSCPITEHPGRLRPHDWVIILKPAPMKGEAWWRGGAESACACAVPPMAGTAEEVA